MMVFFLSLLVALFYRCWWRDIDGYYLLFWRMMLALSAVPFVTPLPVGDLNGAPSQTIEPTIYNGGC